MLSKSIVSVQREFHRKFGDDRQCEAAPSRKLIGQSVHQWRETGFVQVKGRTHRNTVRSPENIQRVRIALERSPRRSVQRHSQLLNLLDRSVQRILHLDLHFHPYKLQIIEELTATHKALRIRCCQQMVHTHANLGRFIISDEAIFSLNGSVNKQKCQYWAPTNPRQLHERPLHSPHSLCGVPFQKRELLGPTFSRVMTESL